MLFGQEKKMLTNDCGLGPNQTTLLFLIYKSQKGAMI